MCISSGRTTPGGATPLYVLGSLENRMQHALMAFPGPATTGTCPLYSTWCLKKQIHARGELDSVGSSPPGLQLEPHYCTRRLKKGNSRSSPQLDQRIVRLCQADQSDSQVVAFLCEMPLVDKEMHLRSR